MEMKKSISDTERALRSYGAVSETAWTTDKGEPHASKHHPGGAHGRVFAAVCHCATPREGKTRRFCAGSVEMVNWWLTKLRDVIDSAAVQGPINSPTCTLWSSVRGWWMDLRQGTFDEGTQTIKKTAIISLNRSIKRQYIRILIDLVVQFFSFHRHIF